MMVANTTLLINPVITSRKLMELNTYWTYNSGARRVLKNMNKPPAKMPKKFEMMLRHGTEIKAARYLGASKNSTGSSAMTRRESSSSVTFMHPDMAEFGRSTHEARSLAELKSAIGSAC